VSYPPILDELDLGAPVSLERVGGGCIADARIAAFKDGTRVFVKTVAGHAEMFEREAEGLRALAAAEAIRIPRVLAISSEALVLEAVTQGSPGRNFSETFGRQFAALHQHRGKTCGFLHDNFIGSTPQPNQPLIGSWDSAPADDGAGWPEFFLQRRLRFQVLLAEQKGHGSELARLLEQAESHLMDLLSAAIEPASILHGDLWGGNYMVDQNGEPCLIDPAVYYGHREADLAMTRLFGGFDSMFYAAYEEALPLVPGHQERLPAYQLYHVLNHLNLFGGSYYHQSKRILQKYAR
jgi:fructosamine-3-kinase